MTRRSGPKLVGRVQGANFASIYGRTKAMGYRKRNPAGRTHLEILHDFPSGYPPRQASETIETKKSRIVFVGKIPDNTDDIRSTKDISSWKRMCYCILKK